MRAWPLNRNESLRPFTRIIRGMDVCPFCNPPAENIIARNDLCYAMWDRFPVNKGHALVIPFRNTPDFSADHRRAGGRVRSCCCVPWIDRRELFTGRVQCRVQCWRGRGADDFPLQLPRDPEICRGCAGAGGRGPGGCAGEEGVLILRVTWGERSTPAWADPGL